MGALTIDVELHHALTTATRHRLAAHLLATTAAACHLFATKAAARHLATMAAARRLATTTVVG